MKEILILAICEFLSVLPIYFIIFGILNKIYKHKENFNSKNYFLKTLIFVFYIYGVLYFTGVGTIFHIKYYGGITTQLAEFNLIPFSREINVVSYILNVLMFVPLGFLLPYIWGKINNIKNILGYGFLFSLIIEISQLFNYRQTDIDDLIMNTFGAVVGFVLFRTINKKIKFKNNFSQQIKFEPLIYFLALFLSHFLLFNEYLFEKVIYYGF